MQLIEMLEARRLYAAGPGDVDATFGTNGVIAFPELSSNPSSSLITPAGNNQFFLSGNQGLHKINADGSTDTSFGVNGFVTRVYNEPAPLVGSDGKIIVFGVEPAPSSAVAIRRFNADGTID